MGGLVGGLVGGSVGGLLGGLVGGKLAGPGEIKFGNGGSVTPHDGVGGLVGSRHTGFLEGL